jgi:CheY-like chemotaxis protein
VDDDDFGRAQLKTALEADGWEVKEATNGRAALACLEEARPDGVILDLIMPEMDGFEFLDEMHRRPEWQDVPVVVVTAKDLTEKDRGRLNLGVERIIHKKGRDETLDELRGALGKFVELRRSPVGAEA